MNYLRNRSNRALLLRENPKELLAFSVGKNVHTRPKTQQNPATKDRNEEAFFQQKKNPGHETVKKSL